MQVNTFKVFSNSGVTSANSDTDLNLNKDAKIKLASQPDLDYKPLRWIWRSQQTVYVKLVLIAATEGVSWFKW